VAMVTKGVDLKIKGEKNLHGDFDCGNTKYIFENFEPSFAKLRGYSTIKVRNLFY
jgi:hypothetical protein